MSTGGGASPEAVRRHQRASELFLEACQRPLAERERFVRAACGSDEELRAEVLALLARDEEAGHAEFLEEPASFAASASRERSIADGGTRSAGDTLPLAEALPGAVVRRRLAWALLVVALIVIAALLPD